MFRWQANQMDGMGCIALIGKVRDHSLCTPQAHSLLREEQQITDPKCWKIILVFGSSWCPRVLSLLHA